MREMKSEETVSLNLENRGRWLLVVSAISTACILGWLLKYSRYGFDFTDESFYLVWMANPFEYKWAITQFGFLYHPLYQLLNGNISALRQANILLTFGSASLLVNQFIKVIVPGSSPNKLQRWILSLAFACASLVVFDSWLLTPSYNNLALQAMCVATIGLLMAEGPSTIVNRWGLVLMGVGLWLTFLAKPTTAILLGAFLGVFLGVQMIKRHGLFIIGGVATGLLILTALVIDESLFKYIDRLRTGGHFAGLQDGGYSLRQIFRLDRFRLNESEILLLFFVGLTSFLSARWCASNRTWAKMSAWAILVSFFSAILLVVFKGMATPFPFGQFHNLTLWAVPLAALGLGITLTGRGYFSAVSLSQKKLACLFLVLPHVYAFGSNNNYFYKGSSASLFWILAGLIFMIPLIQKTKNWLIALPFSLATQLIVILILQIGFENPYRQTGPIRMNKYKVEVRPGSFLVLSKDFSDHIKEVIGFSLQAGFERNTPLIDLTGQSPGILYAMGAESIGQPWMIGGYNGSLNLATQSLLLVPCEKIAKAWVLAEPGGPRSISNDLLDHFGVNFREHYEPVAMWKTPRGAGGYEKRPDQILLKPTKPMALAVQACLEAKSETYR